MNRWEFKNLLNNLNVTSFITLTYPMSFVVKPVSEICAMSDESIPIIRNRVRSNPGYWLEAHLRKIISIFRKDFYGKHGELFFYLTRKEFRPVKHPSIVILSNLNLNKTKDLENITKVWSDIVYENSFFPRTVKIESYSMGDADYFNRLSFILREPFSGEEISISSELRRAMDCYLLEKKSKNV